MKIIMRSLDQIFLITTKRLFIIGLLSAVSMSALSSADWQIGAGIDDITGPAADRGMVGYGNTDQTTKGIRTRLWSRAFVIADPKTQLRVVFVSADLMGITQGIKQGVINKLQARFGAQYTDANVMLTATHTHIGPGGFDHHMMLNLSTLGYDGNNYATIVDGIYDSIVQATNNLSPGYIYENSGDLLGASINRNVIPYNDNPDQNHYAHNTPKRMTVLKLTAASGRELGMISWFAVHNTSSSNTERRISGDNKGIASQLFEKDKSPAFVAAFANSNEGDVSPNVCGPRNGCAGGSFANSVLSGTKQYQKAKELYQSATRPVKGTLAYRHTYVNLPGLSVSGEFTHHGRAATVCGGSIGWSMTAGSGWDGPTYIEGVFEGMTQDNEGITWAESGNLFTRLFTQSQFAGLELFGTLSDRSEIDDACQYPKPSFVSRTPVIGSQLYTKTLPFQLFQIGHLALVSVPGEMTTMAGRRLQKQLRSDLGSRNVEQIIVAGLANAYTGYITTPEEYARQHYEGAHTVFGPNTLAAYQQIYRELATALVDNRPVDPGPTPEDLSNSQIVHTIGVVYDDKRLWEYFGQTVSNAKSSYKLGDTATARFRSGHPQNNYRTGGSFLEVQRYINGRWEVFLTDNDIATEFRWIRDNAFDCLACSFAEIYWTIGGDTPQGTYRLVHRGHWKNGWNGNIQGYSGTSRSFTVY